MNQNLKEKFKRGITYGVVLSSIVTMGVLGGTTFSKYFAKVDGEGVWC